MSIEITVLVTLGSLGLAYLGYRKGVIDSAKEEGQVKGNIQADIQYIKRLNEDILLEQRDTKKTLSNMSERITRNEEAVKQAHKRIDRLEG